jgi:hypothetical protein
LYKAYAVVTNTNINWIEIRHNGTKLDSFETPKDIGLDGSEMLTAAFIEDDEEDAGAPAASAEPSVLIPPPARPVFTRRTQLN